MSPREHACFYTVHSTEVPVYTKPVLRSSGSVGKLDDELAVVFDTAEEVVGPEAFAHTKDAASSYLGLATDYLASFKAAQLGLKAADGVLDTLDRATRCEDDCKEVDIVESLPMQKFGDMNFNTEGYNSEGDSDYCPSEEDCEEDDLEYDSEAEVSDAEVAVVCEKAKANNYVRSLQRRCRAVRRAGTKRAGTARPVETIGEASLVGAICETFNLNFFLSVVGLKLEPVNKMIAKQVIDAAEEENFEVSFSQLNLKDYDSEEDADYCPSESDDDSELEYDSEAEISEESDEEEHIEEASIPFCELDCKDYLSEEDEDYYPSESDLEYFTETFNKPVLRSSASGDKLNSGLDMKDFEEGVGYEYESDEISDESDEISEESDGEEVTDEVPAQKFCEFNFKEDDTEDADYCPSESEDGCEAVPFTKPVLRNSAKVSELNNGLNFKDYKEDADYYDYYDYYCSSESEEDSEYDSDTEVSEESDVE